MTPMAYHIGVQDAKQLAAALKSKMNKVVIVTGNTLALVEKYLPLPGSSKGQGGVADTNMERATV